MDWGKKNPGKKRKNIWKGKEQKWEPSGDPDAFTRPEITPDTERQKPEKKEWKCVCKKKNRPGWFNMQEQMKMTDEEKKR